MKTVDELIAENIFGQSLDILLFGPAPNPPATDARVRDLQTKREEMKRSLESQGHHVRYGEDLAGGSLDPPLANPALRELLVMKDCDLVINLIHTPGTIAELGLLADKPAVCQKTFLMIADDHAGGFVASGPCRLAEDLGAKVWVYSYPSDVTACNLVKKVLERARALQIAKYLT